MSCCVFRTDLVDVSTLVYHARFFFDLSPINGLNGFDVVGYCKEVNQVLRQISATSEPTIDSVTRCCIRWCRIDNSRSNGGGGGGGDGSSGVVGVL